MSGESKKGKKFDVVIGNPPYQENDGGVRADGSVSASASPIYPDFVRGASEISKVHSLLIPARWTTGAGKGLSGFSKEMLSSKSVKRFNYFTDAQDVFPDNQIMGGIAFYAIDKDYIGEANIRVHYKGGEDRSTRYLDEYKVGVFIPFKELSNIISKIKAIDNIEEVNLSSIVSPRQPYGLPTDFFNNPQKYGLDRVYTDRNSDNDIVIFGRINHKRTKRYIPGDYELPKGEELIDCYKVFTPRAYGGGNLDGSSKIQVLGESIVAEPYQICTETYLSIGCLHTKYEAESLSKYIRSKFLQALVAILKSTQDAPRRVYGLVPLQDFTEDSDIDWSKTIPEIDQQLYKKYNLNEEEIAFIEENIKEMS